MEVENDSKIKTGNILENLKTFADENEYISIKELIDKYNNENACKITDKLTSSLDAEEIISYNMKKTPKDKQQTYSKIILDKINTLKKSNVSVELPKLPYDKRLSDNEFISLFEKCAEYANSNLDSNNLEKIKSHLINLEYFIQNLFKLPQLLKDLKENALLTILVSNDEQEQMDNFNLLKVQYSSVVPLISMNFKEYELNKKELIETFTSHIYIKNYMKVLGKFIPNFKKIVPNEREMKKYILNYFNRHDIYFAELPDNIMAVSIHTGNIFLKSKYIYEYYFEKDKDSQLIVREKIVLNIAHELNYVLIREISDIMKDNFLVKSSIKDKNIKEKEIKFINKFDDNYHILSIEESGNLFDYYFYDKFYFDDLYEREAELFLNIKEIKTLNEYRNKLNKIISEEKAININCDLINKFKKMKQEPSRCIKSKILGITEKKYAEIVKLYDEDDE